MFSQGHNAKKRQVIRLEGARVRSGWQGGRKRDQAGGREGRGQEEEEGEEEEEEGGAGGGG